MKNTEAKPSDAAPTQDRWARLKSEWFSNPKNDILAALAVALALIPEAIAFSLIAGVDPQVGLFAAFMIATTTSIFGGRPGMISGATGAVALVAAPLVASHGIEYLFAATVMTGVVQLVFRVLRLSRYIRFVPRPVMTGFVNALAILIFMAQMPQLTGGDVKTYGLVLAGLAIIYGLPKLTKAVPSPLAAIVLLTLVIIFSGTQVHSVGDMGALPDSLPVFHLPQVPFTVGTLAIVLPYAVAMGMVGILESLLTATVVDEMTDTTSCKHTEAHGQGIANLLTGFFGGMAGCAMIGQSVINVQSGGRTRLSGFCAGIFLLFFVVVLGPWVALIPSGALVAVMIAVSVGTFDWKSVPRMRIMPLTETIVMIATVVTVVFTHDLSKGVAVGILASAIFFARQVSKLISVEQSEDADGLVYRVQGQLFFVSVETFNHAFDFSLKERNVTIDLSHAHVWDTSAVSAIDRAVLKLREGGNQVTLLGMNDHSLQLVDRIGTHQNADAAPAPGH